MKHQSEIFSFASMQQVFVERQGNTPESVICRFYGGPHASPTFVGKLCPSEMTL